MYLGYFKNFRVWSSGGIEFFMWLVIKFKGVLVQKFMFVDGDWVVCGFYSFMWLVVWMDWNVIFVLFGQVVEMFDWQFQELYFMLYSVSFKGIFMEKELELEFIVLFFVVFLVFVGFVVKKFVNFKYVLVKVKSVDEIVKIFFEKQEVKKFLGLKGLVLVEYLGDIFELLLFIYLGLFYLERVNMFEYLFMWVELDLEFGSDILGYINIIDFNIWNFQFSQMNCIKICDIFQVSVQYQLWK